jgi:hypothetical protein
MVYKIAKKPIKDELGWTIPKGTRLFILKRLKALTGTGYKVAVAVDNGTGIKELMPKTLIDEKEFEKGTK